MTEKNSPAVSVIIPLYNAEKYLSVCLESILIQTFTDFEVLLVDDCSTDNSVTIAESFLERFNGRLKIVSLEKNTGSGAVPRNVGLDLARGKYVYFMDNDDLIVDNALEELFNAAETFQAEVICMNKYFVCNEEVLPQNLTEETWGPDPVPDAPTLETDDLAERVRNLMRFSYMWHPWSKFLRRDFLVDNKIFLPQMTISDDVIWTLKIVCLAKKILRVPTRLYIYRDNENSVMRRKRSPEQMVKFRINPLLNGMEYLEEFMSGQKFFKENPLVKLYVLNFFDNINFGNMGNALTRLELNELYEIILREFSEAGSSQPALIAYMFVMKNVYQSKMTKS